MASHLTHIESLKFLTGVQMLHDHTVANTHHLQTQRLFISLISSAAFLLLAHSAQTSIPKPLDSMIPLLHVPPLPAAPQWLVPHFLEVFARMLPFH